MFGYILHVYINVGILLTINYVKYLSFLSFIDKPLLCKTELCSTDFFSELFKS